MTHGEALERATLLGIDHTWLRGQHWTATGQWVPPDTLRSNNHQTKGCSQCGEAFTIDLALQCIFNPDRCRRCVLSGVWDLSRRTGTVVTVDGHHPGTHWFIPKRVTV